MSDPCRMLPEKAAPLIDWVRAWKAYYAHFYYMATCPHPDRLASRVPGDAEKHWAERMVESSLGVHWHGFFGNVAHHRAAWAAVVHAGQISVSQDGQDPGRVTVEIPRPETPEISVDENPLWDDLEMTPWTESAGSPW